MSLSQPIAIATLTASMLLTAQTPHGMRFWTQTKSLNRSLAIVLTLYIGTLLDTSLEYFSLEWARPSLSFVLLMAASRLLIEQKKHSGSVWASRRILPLTWAVAFGSAAGLIFAELTNSEFYAACTFFAGLLHMMNIRAENSRNLALFSELTMRISSLQAAQFSIQSKLKTSEREARDITLRLESYRRETMESLKLQQDSASWICMRRLHNAVYGEHPYSLPVSGIEKSVNKFSAEALQASFETWRDGGPWVFALAGGAPLELVQKSLTAAFKNFKPKKAKRVFSGVATASLEALGIPLNPRRKQEQAHLAIAKSGPGWGTGCRPAMDVLINILGGHGGRLFTTLRDQESLAYTVSEVFSQDVVLVEDFASRLPANHDWKTCSLATWLFHSDN